MEPRRGERQPPRALDAAEPPPPRGVRVGETSEEHARVVRVPRADRAHQQDRRAEAATVEVVPRRHGSLERRLVEEWEVAVHMAEVVLHERVEEVGRGEGGRFEDREVVFYEGFDPLRARLDREEEAEDGGMGLPGNGRPSSDRTGIRRSCSLVLVWSG